VQFNVTKGDVEREVRKIINRMHQEVLGKGPDQLWVKLNQNVGTFYCTKTLTPMEEFLLKTSDGKEKVLVLRKAIAEVACPRLSSEIELLCGTKVLSITGKLSVDTDAIFGAILFAEDFQ